MTEKTLTWASWPPNSTISLCNVTWDASYRDIVKFSDTADQERYFEGLKKDVIKNSTMVKFGLPIDLPIAFNRASKYNYMIVDNDYDFDDKRKWYYFIQSVDYVNANVTRFHIMLDVWQSFQFDVKLGRCFVERGHIGIANDKQNENYGLNYLDIPEGLDLGNTPRIQEDHEFAFLEPGSDQDENAPGVLIMSTTDLTADPQTKENPKLKTATGSSVNGVFNGISIYFIDSLNGFGNFMLLSSAFPWVTEGIIGIWMVPPRAIRKGQQIKPFGGKTGDSGYDDSIFNLIHMYVVTEATYDKVSYSENDFRQIFIRHIPQRYHNLKKLQIYPYSYVEMTMQNGSSLIIQPQYVGENNLEIHESIWASAPGPRSMYYPEHYAGGEDLNTAIGVVDWPRLVMVNNQGIAYLASNAHSIQYQYNTADWAQQKTQMGINNAYAQANAGTSYNSQQTRLGNQNRNASNAIASSSLQQGNDIAAQQQNTNYLLNQVNAGVNGAMGTLGQITGGNIGGAAGAAVGTVLGMGSNFVANEQQTATRNANLSNTLATNSAQVSQANNFSTASTNLSNQQTMQFADMNRSLGLAVASGDYANTIAGINAHVQDAQLSQPSLSGGMGGDAFLYALSKWKVHLRFKMISPAAMRNIGEFWLRYGYYIQRFLIPPESLMCMKKFTYWKMHELYIRSSTCPEEFRLTIKGIFEKGVTVWKNPNDIGVTDYADNEPLQGISY